MSPRPTCHLAEKSVRRSVAILALSVFLHAASPVSAWFFGNGWPELTDEERAVASSVIDPEAGAEILYREVTVDDGSGRRITSYFNRVKIFDQRGVEAMAQIDLSSWDEERVTSVKARIIRPDGSIEELERDAVHQQEVMKKGRFEVGKTSFALPGLVPGCIVDYKWSVVTDNWYYDYRLFTRLNFPTHHLRFRVRYHPGTTGGWTFRDSTMEMKKVSMDWHELRLTDLPARSDEPYLPPSSAIEPWVTIYYLEPGRRSKDWIDDFWDERARSLSDHTRGDVRTRDREIRAKAAELTAELPDDEEKLRAIYTFCVDGIRNIHSDRAGLSGREIEELKEADSAHDVLRLGYGTPYYIKALFGSLAAAAGFEARLVFCSDRSRYIFDRNMAFWSALPDILVAVRPKAEKSDEAWRFFDPGTSYVPFGQLHWTNEGAHVLMADKGKARFLLTPLSGAESTTVTRRADLSLNEEGTLSGSVSLRYTGHLAAIEKSYLDHQTASQREESLKEELSEALPGIEISHYTIEQLASSSEPLEIRFDLRVPRYADQTSSRIFFEPATFQRGSKPVFIKPTREFPIAFPFLWTEDDELSITLPEGYELEEAAAPRGAIDVPPLRHKLRLFYRPSTRQLGLERKLVQNAFSFQIEQYSAVKGIYELIDRQDHHLLTLRKVEAGAAVPPPVEPEPAPVAGATTPAESEA